MKLQSLHANRAFRVRLGYSGSSLMSILDLPLIDRSASDVLYHWLRRFGFAYKFS